jgi:hypothetical protein
VVGTWKSSRRSRLPIEPPIATYTAEVFETVRHSTLSIVDPLTRRQVTALRTPPEWTLSGWTSVTPGSPREFEHLALLKMKALLDFDAGLPNGSSQAIIDGLAKRFGPRAFRPTDGNALRVTVVVRDDGKAEWGAEVDGSNELPLGITDSSLDPGRPLKVLVQNLVRADIQQHLERLTP